MSRDTAACPYCCRWCPQQRAHPSLLSIQHQTQQLLDEALQQRVGGHPSLVEEIKKNHLHSHPPLFQFSRAVEVNCLVQRNRQTELGMLLSHFSTKLGCVMLSNMSHAYYSSECHGRNYHLRQKLSESDGWKHKCRQQDVVLNTTILTSNFAEDL